VTIKYVIYTTLTVLLTSCASALPPIKKGDVVYAKWKNVSEANIKDSFTVLWTGADLRKNTTKLYIYNEQYDVNYCVWIVPQIKLSDQQIINLLRGEMKGDYRCVWSTYDKYVEPPENLATSASTQKNNQP